jgi:ketosteroid isomerase-like protein
LIAALTTGDTSVSRRHCEQRLRGLVAAVGLAVFAALPFSQPAWAQGARIPADAVDAFHAALKAKDTAAALSLLDRDLVVFEFGVVDPTVEAYAFQHLPFDIDVAATLQWQIESRRVGGEGDVRWVLTAYHVTGRQSDGSPIDQITLETMILRRHSGLFRIAHMHWSTDDAKFQASSQPNAQPGTQPSARPNAAPPAK